jgi:hypothetical protein
VSHAVEKTIPIRPACFGLRQVVTAKTNAACAESCIHHSGSPKGKIDSKGQLTLAAIAQAAIETIAKVVQRLFDREPSLTRYL